MKVVAVGHVITEAPMATKWAVVVVGQLYAVPTDGLWDGGDMYDDDELKRIMELDAIEASGFQRYRGGAGQQFGDEPTCVNIGDIFLVTQDVGLDV